MANNSFVFYRGFFDILKKLTDSQKTEFVMKLCAYALDCEEPTFDEGSPLDLIFIAVKPQIDANMRRMEKGKFGVLGKEYGVMGKDFGILGKEYGSLGGEFGVLGKEYGKLGGRPKKTPPPLKKTPAPPNANANANANANVNANEELININSININNNIEKKEKEKKDLEMSFCGTIRKDEVLAFLKSQGMAWREQTMMYLRIGDNQKKLDELIELFSAKMYSDDMAAQTENQLKSYFGNWARNEIQREKKEQGKEGTKPNGSFAEYAHGIDGKNFAESWNKFLKNNKKS